jgi:hypothetical protein
VSESVGVFFAVGMKIWKHQLVYQGIAWRGDSGGAVLLYDGEVAALHRKSVNGIFALKELGKGKGKAKKAAAKIDAIDLQSLLSQVADLMKSAEESTSQSCLAVLAKYMAEFVYNSVASK